MMDEYIGVKVVEISEASEQLKAALGLHLPEAWTPSEKKQGSELAGESLKDYFTLVADSNLTIPWTVEDLELYSEGYIDEGQISYRWYPEDYGSGDVLDGWHANWLVLGQRSGDPVIFDQDTGAVMMAYHGMGGWTPEIVASNVADFVGILAVWVRVAIGEFQGKVRNEDTSELEPVLKERIAESLLFIPQPFRDNFLSFLN